jgi:hypothetical protein
MKIETDATWGMRGSVYWHSEWTNLIDLSVIRMIH